MTVYDKNEAADLTPAEKKGAENRDGRGVKARAHDGPEGRPSITEDTLMAKRDIFSELVEGVRR